MDKCPSGHEFERQPWGYQCTAGGHRVTWAQLAENRQAKRAKAETSAPTVADQGMQDRIASAMNRLGMDEWRNGYAFERQPWGYQCQGGGHQVTWAQLGEKGQATNLNKLHRT